MDQILLEEEKESKKQYRFSLWWVEHRATLKKAGLVLLIIFDGVLGLFVLWSLLDSFALSYGKEQSAVAQSVVLNQEDLHAYTNARVAEPLIISNDRFFDIGNRRYDVYAQIENNNSDWWAEFSYQFVYDGGKTNIQKGFILPGEKKPVAELAMELDAPPTNVQLQFQDVDWHRVNHHDVGDYAKWFKDRMDLKVQNPTLIQNTTGDPSSLVKTTFTVRNDSAFSYYQPIFYLLLKRGSSVTGVNRVTLQSLDSGASQDVTVNWFGTVPSVSQVEVIPEINIFDIKLYKPLVGESSADTRARIFQ